MGFEPMRLAPRDPGSRTLTTRSLMLSASRHDFLTGVAGIFNFNYVILF